MSGLEDLRRQLRALAVSALPLEDIWRRSDVLLRRAVPWEVSAWGQVDPATLLSTGCLVLGMPFDGERERAVSRSSTTIARSAGWPTSCTGSPRQSGCTSRPADSRSGRPATTR